MGSRRAASHPGRTRASQAKEKAQRHEAIVNVQFSIVNFLGSPRTLRTRRKATITGQLSTIMKRDKGKDILNFGLDGLFCFIHYRGTEGTEEEKV